MARKVKIGRREISVPWTIADRVVEAWDPVRAQRRLGSRVAMALAGGAYQGANKSKRSLSGWQTPKGTSADADLLPALPDLRDRSRDLERNEPLAAGAINTVVTNVVGSGLRLQSQILRDILGMTPEEAKAWQRSAEIEFELFLQDVDAARRLKWSELQDVVVRSELASGDVLSLLPMIERKGSVYATRVQLVEGDRLCNSKRAIDKPTLAGGVEMDAHGAPVAYHILRQHPGGLLRTSTDWDIVPAFGEKTGRRNVLHIYRQKRPGQTRGEPYLTPVIEHIKKIGRYSEAEIDAAVVSAFFAVFIKGSGASLSPVESAMTGETAPASGDPAKVWDGTLSPGLVAELGPGEEIESANPGRPNPAFDDFVMSVLRQVGVALELPFEVLVKHFTASYSAARAALLEAWRFFMRRRTFLAEKFCQPVYEAFLEEAIARGRISAPGFFDDPLLRMAYCGAAWHGDGPGALDPLKEANAIEKRLAIGITTLTKETAAYDGSDWESNHEQQVIERKARMDGDLIAQPAAAPPADDAPDGADREDGDREDDANAIANAVRDGNAQLLAAVANRPVNVYHGRPAMKWSFTQDEKTGAITAEPHAEEVEA